MRKVLIGIAFALLGAGGVTAAMGDRTATSAILSGDLVKAERTLIAERRIFPQRPELMLNLAAVYRQTGRDEQARELYAEVLRSNDVPMDMPDQRIMSSHAIARHALNLPNQVAAR